MFARPAFHFVSATSLAVASLVAAAALVGDVGVVSASFAGQNGKIAFEYAGSIALMNPDGSQQTFIERGSRPAWSADGKRFVWVCNPCSNPLWTGQLVVANADGSFPFSLAVTGNDPAWFPDNNTVVFDRNNSLMTAEIANPGVATTLLAAAPGGHTYSQPAVSPDGSQVAFTDTATDTQSSISVLFVHQIILADGHVGYAATGGPINLTNAPVGTLDSAADWNPNGAELVFARSVRIGNSVLELITEGGGSPTPLPTNNDAWANPKFSPDGNLIVATQTLLSSGDIWTMSSSGGGFLPLTHVDLLSVGHAAWQPVPPPVNTPTGFNLDVMPTDQNPAQPVGATPVELFFDQVTLAGSTTLTTSSAGPAIPAAYFPPSPPLYHHLATTARFRFIANANGVAPCMTDPSVTAYSVLLQFDANGAATDVTDPSNFVPASHFICANPLPSLGTGVFAIASRSIGPTVTQNPASATVNAGSSVSFAAAANANPAATVQWQVSADGGVTFTNISGASSTTLTFTAKATDNNIQFRAVFANASGTATTAAATLTVISPPPASLSVSGISSPRTPGVASDITVAAKDAFGNAATGYTGTVHFSSSDATATLPADYSFIASDNGSHTFVGGVTLKAAGTQWVTVGDTSTSSITGTQSGIVVSVPVPPPTITSISPTSGPGSGGTVVFIHGFGFTGASAVNWGGYGNLPAIDWGVGSDTLIVINASPSGTGTIDITVTTPAGTSATRPTDQFTYIPTPAVSAIAPTSGPQAGGTSVTITGTHFNGATGVSFGSVGASVFHVDSDTQVTVTSPAAVPATGTVHVTVSGPGGTSAISSADRFTYIPAGLGYVVTAAGPAAFATSTASFGAIYMLAAGGGANDAVFLGQYATMPVGGLESSTGTAFDILLVQPSSYSSLTIADCALNGGTSVSWWNGAIWQPVTPAPTYKGPPFAPPPACAQFTLTSTSSPSLSQLTGTVFAATGSSIKHSLSLDGATGYADVPSSASLNPLTNWTVEAWFKDEDPNGFNHDFRQIINKGDRNADPESPYFITIGNNHLLAGVRTGGVDYPIDANLAQLGLDPSKWHHVAVTYRSDLQVLNLWLDGQHISYVAGAPAGAGNTLPVEIGRNGPQAGKYWKGKIDDVRLWNVTRTGAEITGDYLTELTGAPPANLVANWQFDEANGTTATDFVGNSAATLHGGASFSTDVHP